VSEASKPNEARRRRRRIRIRDWPEFLWLIISSPTFRATSNKRRAYIEYRTTKLAQRHYS